MMIAIQVIELICKNFFMILDYAQALLTEVKYEENRGDY
jgi:hypothetical protein